jgi:anti-sigma factor RsiW
VITCRDLVEFLMDYCDGTLPPGQRETFEKHLSCCPPCVNFMKSYQQAICLGKAACADEDQEAKEVPEQLVQAILAARNVSGGK